MQPISYTLVRSRRQTLSLQVDHTGAVTVRAPLRLAQKEIDRFFLSKQDWLSKTLARIRVAEESRPRLTVEDGACLPFLGGSLILRLETRRDARLEGDVLRLPTEDSDQALERWLRRQAREDLAARTARFSALMGLTPSGVKITGARTRWGSCSGQNGLNFTWRLILCPPELIDYVVVHELSHIRHKDHSAAFWNTVEHVLPDCALRRRALQEHRFVMDFL